VSKVWVVLSNFALGDCISFALLAVAATPERAEAEATKVAWSYGMSPLKEIKRHPDSAYAVAVNEEREIVVKAEEVLS